MSQGRGGIDCDRVLGRFWRDRKKYDFPIGKKSTTNLLEIDPTSMSKATIGASKGRKRRSVLASPGVLGGSRVP